VLFGDNKLMSVFAVLVCAVVAQAEAHSVQPGQTFVATDTLSVSPDKSAAARQSLDRLRWKCCSFDVEIEPSDDRGAVLVRFPSPVSTSDPTNDRVAMEWYPARFALQATTVVRTSVPAIVVVHESGRRMTVGRMFAGNLAAKGFHTFLIHLPYYGARLSKNGRRNDLIAMQGFPQAIADVRRARDAVAALPGVDTKRIALQGTSLGGIVSATAASLDDGFDSVFLILAGGDLQSMIENGKNESAQVREKLRRAGVTTDELRKLIEPIEPLRVAHRLNPRRTWLFSGAYDQVIPKANSDALARAAALDDDHHIVMPADHYTGIFFMPVIVQKIAELIRQREGVGE
jgi:dienelactone hydrolase